MTKEQIKDLISERDKIDQELTILNEVLRSNNVTMDSPLVDEESFPIAELDIISIRKARHSIICLINDRKKLTNEIEKLLVDLHENSQSTSNEGSEPMQVKDNEPAPDQVHRTSNRPFLRAENVVYGSPAFFGGLLVDDLVIQCGTIHADNFAGMQHFGEMVREHVGKEMHLTILRKDKVHRLVVNPGQWEGAGVFGARLALIKNEEV